MKSLIKALLWIVGLLFIAVVGIGIAVATLDPNDHKDWIVSKAEKELGRTLKLDGDISMTWYPWLGVEVNELTLGNARGFGDEPFLHFDHLKARVKFLPLLRDQYEIDTVRLHGAVLNLARNKDGVTNWADLVSAEEKEQKPLPLTAVVLGGVDIKDARITWSDAATGAIYEITDITAATGELTYGAPIDLSVSLSGKANQPALDGDVSVNGVISYDLDTEIYGIEPLELNGVLRGKNIPGGQTDITFKAAVTADLDQDTASVSGLQFNALKTAVTGELTATDVESDSPKVQAALDVKGEDLALLFKVLEIEPLATELAALADRKFDLKTRLSGDLGRGDVDLNELSANLLGAAVRGQLKGTRLNSDVPAVRGTLNASGPNLSLLMLVAGQVQGGKDSPLSRAGRRIVDYPHQSFEADVVFDADMKSGDVNAPKIDVKVLGSSLTGELQASKVTSEGPGFKGRLNAQGPDLPALMLVAGQFQTQRPPPLAQYGRKLSALRNKAFDVKLDFDANLERGDVKLPTLYVQALGIGAAGELTAQNMSSTGGRVNGKLTVDIAQADELLRVLDYENLAGSIRSVNMKAGISGTRSDLVLKPLSLNVVVVGEEVGKKPVPVSLTADTRINLEKERLELAALTIKGLGLDASGDLTATGFQTAQKLAGKINVAEFNLRKLMRQLNIDLPPMADPKTLRKVALQSEFSGSRTDLDLKKFAMVLDDTRIGGTVTLKNPEKPVARIALNIDQINLDRYLPPEQPPGAKKPAAAAKKAEEPAVLPVDTLRALDIQGNLEIGKLTVSKARMSNVRLSVNGKNGKIRLDPVAAQLYQGSATGDIDVDVTGKIPKITMNAKLQGVQAEPLLKDMTGEAKMRGTGSFSAALITAGADAETMKKSLNGQMSFRFEDGAIKGYNLGRIMRQGKSLKETFSLSVSDKEETDFAAITGNPVAQNGVVRLDDLQGQSPGLRLRGKGVLADLPRNRIDYNITANLVATSEGQGGKQLEEGKLEGVPLDCRLQGNLDAPVRKCDASKLLAALGVRIFQEALGLPGKLIPGGSTTEEGTATEGEAGGTPLDPGKELLDKTLKSIFGDGD